MKAGITIHHVYKGMYGQVCWQYKVPRAFARAGGLKEPFLSDTSCSIGQGGLGHQKGGSCTHTSHDNDDIMRGHKPPPQHIIAGHHEPGTLKKLSHQSCHAKREYTVGEKHSKTQKKRNTHIQANLQSLPFFPLFKVPYGPGSTNQ